MQKISLFFIVFFLFSAPVKAEAPVQDFSVWLKDVRAEARSRGISARIVEQALPEKMALIDRVLELDRKQPESVISFDAYLKKIVDKNRVSKGQEKMRAHADLLQKIGDAYGVDPSVIAALWGVETNYGKNSGNFNIIQSIATLSYDGRRSDYFRRELFEALKILEEGHVDLPNMKGSWAGAMGQIQFMPSSFFRFAQDFNNDGHRDIWGSEADIFASAANYLASSGWKKGEPWGRKVTLLESFDRGLLGLEQQHSLRYWHDHGVRLANGKALSFDEVDRASVIQPGGPGTSAFIVYGNYRAVLKWNKSNYFATSVGLLSDRLGG